MKLTVLGGGGVRAVYLAQSLIKRAEIINLNHIVFMDNNVEKLNVYGKMAKKIAERMNPAIRFEITSDAVYALKDADFIITTLRVGQDVSRTFDERIALKHGVLGQETTGAGGFAMALRSVPALIEYCKLIREYSSPNAKVFNFTNPSGLVTQALRDEGFHNVFGICDSPSGFKKRLSDLLKADESSMSVECFGLNHLSWFRSVKINNAEVIQKIIDNPLLYTDKKERLFDRSLIENSGMLFNEYLYFFYYREKAVENVLKSTKTRGETICEINAQMYDELKAVDLERDFEKSLEIYNRYHEQRSSSYMSIESNGIAGKAKGNAEPVLLQDEESGGYAEVALDCIDAFLSGDQKEVILSVPNEGAIPGLDDSDIVEITCTVDKTGVKPVPIGDVPEVPMALIRQVKLYERLASRAIRQKSIKTAIDALMVHPLINSYSIAVKLVEDYLEANKKYTGEWR